MTDAPSPRCSSGTEQPLAWHCCDDRYPWIKDIVTTSPTTIDAWRDGGIKFQPLYPRGNAQAASLKLGDIVEFNAAAPYASEWRGVKLKVVSLRMSPDGALWVSIIEPEDRMAHRGNGYYDGETTDIPAEHLSSVPSTEGK